MTKILVTGAGGMLGHDLMSELRDLNVVGFTRQDLDIRHSAQVAEAVAGFDVVVKYRGLHQSRRCRVKPRACLRNQHHRRIKSSQVNVDFRSTSHPHFY